MQSISLKQPLLSRLYVTQATSLQRKILMVVIGSLLIALSAKISIPLHPVPVSMQVLAVLFIGMIYGPRLGGATVLAYLLEGAYGLPVFAEPFGGLVVFMDPTAGYLLGFLPAAMLSGYLVEKGLVRSMLGAALAGFSGLAVLYLCGLTGLMAFVGFSKALVVGITPFMLLDGLKVILIASIIPKFWRPAHQS